MYKVYIILYIINLSNSECKKNEKMFVIRYFGTRLSNNIISALLNYYYVSLQKVLVGRTRR